MAREYPELSADQLRAHIDPASLPFDSTASLEPPQEKVVGQDRASDAIKFGVGMKDNGYHIYIAGPAQTGLSHIAKVFLEDQASREPTPPDWCYVYNFKEPDKPMHLSLSSGRGQELKKDMQDFVEALKDKIPEVFESDDYRAKDRELRLEFERHQRGIIENLSRETRERGFILQVSQVGMVIIPATKEGQPMSQEMLAQLSEPEKLRLKETSNDLQIKMKDALKEIRRVEGDIKQRHAKLDGEVALFVVDQALEPFWEKYRGEEGVLEYLGHVKDNVLESVDDFKKKEEPAQQQQMMPFPVPQRDVTFRRFEINVLVDNAETKGAPVLVESNPIYPNLFGAIERQAWLGALFTDFTMIKAGTLHRANGGYLVMKAMDLLKWYLSYEAMKRALREQQVRIEDMGELYGLFTTRTIRPEPIPLNLKIVLTGDPFLFELLHFYDESFKKLFKVKAHLDDRMDNKDETVLHMAQSLAEFCRKNDLRHLDRGGVARLIEFSIEKTQDREKLTLEVGDMENLVREANYFAGQGQKNMIDYGHVEEAIKRRVYRSNLVEERIKELIEKDIFWVETEGERVGQINGLSVLKTGDHEFGKPNRITATVAVGQDGVVAIERESKLSGPIHTKGVLILASFLQERFAHNKPVSLSASLCFEQSYGYIEGDSASSTELYSLLSALSGVPIKQGIAVTGSVSQKGEIQAIGGVTYKVESFFDICRHKGLNGHQGVIIPRSNVKNLMLKREVVSAAREGLFHIWPVSTIEEGIEILTGMEAGALQPDGSYPKGTLFRRVDERFLQMAEIARKFGKGGEEGRRKWPGEDEE